MKKFLKVGSIILLSVLILAGVLAYITPYLLGGPLKEALIEKFNEQTGQEYKLQFSDLHIRLYKRSVSVDSISISPVGEPGRLRSVSASSFSINGIQWFSLLQQPFPSFRSVVINEPHVELRTGKISTSYFESSDSTSTAVKNLEKFNLIIKNGSGRMTQPDKTEIVTIENISIEAQQVDVNALLSGSEFVFLHNLKMDGSGFKWMIHKKLYSFSIADFSFNKRKEWLTLSNVRLTPLVPKYEFLKFRGHQIDRLTMDIPKLEINGFDLDSLAIQKLEVDSIRLYNPTLEVFRDKHKERPYSIQFKPLLYEVATSTDFSFGLNNVAISDGEITYEEHKPPSEQPASITFNKLNASINTFRTQAHPQFKSDTLTMHVETLFMNSSPLTVDVKYPVFNRYNAHSVHVELGSLDPKKVQPMLVRSGFVRVEDGLVDGLTADMKLNSDSATGQVVIRYRDLKVAFLNKEEPGKEGLAQKVGSFFANTFVLKSDNTGEDPRVGEVDFKREKRKSIFAYWWKALLSGLKDSIR